MKRVYLDSNILIAHYSIDQPEEPKRKLVEKTLSVFAALHFDVGYHGDGEYIDFSKANAARIGA